MSDKRRYTKEQKENAVRMVRTNEESIPTIAKNLGISEHTLRRWLKQVDIDHDKTAEGALTTDQLEEIRQRRIEQFSMFNSLMNGFPDTTCYVKDIDGVFIDCNEAYITKTLEGRLTRETLLNGEMDDLKLGFPKADCAIYSEHEEEVVKKGIPITRRYAVHNKDGKLIRWEKTTKIPFRNTDGAIIGTIGISTDISELIQAQDELKISIELARILTNSSTEGILVLRNHKIFLSNPYAAQLLGFTSAEELEGLPIKEILAPDQLELMTAKLEQSYTESHELHFLTKDKSSIVLAVQGKISTEAKGTIFNLRRVQEQTDPLTGLILKKAFSDALEWELKKVAQTHIAIGFIDVNNLKFVNDTCKEHTNGDLLLKEVAETIKSCIRVDGDILARMYQGGDEFCLMFPMLPTDGEKTFEIISNKVAHITSQLDQKKIVLDNQIEVPINMAIGITIFKRSAGNPTAEDLLREADAVMYIAKKDAEALQKSQSLQWKPTNSKIIFSKFNHR